MARRSQTEWQDVKREQEERTDEALDESKEIQEDASQTTEDWNEQDEPCLVETGEALGVISRELGRDIEQTHGEQAEEVTGDIEDQVRDVSDPAREDEQVEHGAAEHLSDRVGREGRFGERLQEASDQRREAEEFLGEVAEEDEAHQEASGEQLKEHEQAVDEAIKSLNEFEG